MRWRSPEGRWLARLGGTLAACLLLPAAAGHLAGQDTAPPATTAPGAPGDSTAGGPSTAQPTTSVHDFVIPTVTRGTPVEVVTTIAGPPPGEPADVARDVPPAAPTETAPAAPPPPWAASVTTTAGGHIRTDVGCAGGTGSQSLDAFFAQRIGPVMGMDYQHVVSLGNGRYAWFFQDTFIDPGGSASTLRQSHFAHNAVLVQDGACFSLLHRGTAANPAAFEQGNGDDPLKKWFWPMGGETFNGVLTMFWAEMVKDPYTPGPGDGLGWHPARTWLATYDARTLQRLSFAKAPNSGTSPIYGYAVASDAEFTYLFGNTFEQNLVREGGFFGQRHSGTRMYLARVPRGRFGSAPEYRTADGWSASAADAQPFAQRFWVEYPMQPRFIDGQWVSAAKVDGYWGEQLIVEVANQPWGPWTVTEQRGLSPRGGDPKMNTYHAHLLPWRSGNGNLVIALSQNARNMPRDAFPHPERYRITVFTSGWVVPPPDPVPTTTTTSTSSTSSTSTTTTTTVPESSTSSTSSTSTTSTTTTTTTTTSTTTASTTAEGP